VTDQLPIHEIISEVKKVLANNNTIILQALPGAGKSTVLPLELINESWLSGKKILMLEPRRLAARSVANRMADTIDEEIGKTVGFRIRFENKISSGTKIEVVTEGILTRMLQSDNSLSEYGLVIFDEFHERSLHADLALALCREAQKILRDDLKIMIMSATISGEKLSSLLGNASIITSKGKQYKVDLEYFPEEKDTFISQRVARAIKKAINNQEGDILTFLPGAGEIIRTQEILENEISGINVFPLYGDLSYQKQQEAIKRSRLILRASEKWFLPHPSRRQV
jgi:ATP-dependent helicase HrpB